MAVALASKRSESNKFMNTMWLGVSSLLSLLPGVEGAIVTVLVMLVVVVSRYLANFRFFSNSV